MGTSTREASLVNMGKGPKHNSKSRNNGIFKVAGQNFKQGNKGKPKEVTSKLKLISRKNNEKVEDLDSTMKMLQHKGSVTGKSLAGDKETVEKPKIPVVPRKDLVNDQMMDDLAESMNSS